jgi:hypothetical protein
MIGERVEAFLADRGYDADAIREQIAAAGVEAVIRPRAIAAIRSRMTRLNTAGATWSSACSTN